MIDLPNVEQVLIVVTSDWDSKEGKLWRYEKSSNKLSLPISVTVGEKGMAWGRGLHTKMAQSGEPLKKEGDGKAPAGVFALGPLFGYGESICVKMPYMEVDEHLECVDDPASGLYNRFVRRANIFNPDWKSSEQMTHELYTLGAVIQHNTLSPRAGEGSCIFMHRWSAPEVGTAGCTAMDRDNLRDVLTWLDEAKYPVIVQFPKAVYERVQQMWDLPFLPNL